MSNLNSAQLALKKYFGYDTFRPMQAEIIQSVFDQRDALVLMPTGGGKSICYQIPAISLPGTCIVLSPLISLMKDQVEGLRSNGIAAAYLNSSMGLPEIRKTEDNLLAGKLDLLYVSPEKMTSAGFLPLVKRAKINLIAIDEAHCISAWGHDFRPEYTQLQFLKREFAKVPIIALTATADKITRQDIVDQLKLHEPNTFISSFDRPNLSLTVRPGQKRFEQILQFIQERPNQSGIVYCLSRKSTEKLAEKLVNKGISADAYHAGLPPGKRAKVQEDFINDTTPIVCATIAFGMGIDKSNVRWVIHYNLPKNLEGYYQEIGRAGRDGVKADTLLFYSFQDVSMMREILGNSEGENQEVQLAKLNRMQQYAEAQACRRKILLNYFSEELQEDCGNCDVCQNPPESFDGTVIAQKALSAIYRLKQSVGMTTVIEVLRGSGRREILSKGYQNIKTYGAGRDIPYLHWQQYLLQLLNLGFIEIAFHDKNQVQLTSTSKQILFEGRKIQLVRPETIKKREDKAKAEAKKTKQKLSVGDELFQTLRQLRKRLAQERGIPPYRIFSDASLMDMVEKRPMSSEEFLNVMGVGEQKLATYGDDFIDVILNFVSKKTGSIKGSTYQLTLGLLNQGKSLDEIVAFRGLNQRTVMSHIAYLYEMGHPIDVSPYITEKEIDTIKVAFNYVQKPVKMKDIYEYFDEQYSYDKIRLTQAYLKRSQQLS